MSSLNSTHVLHNLACEVSIWQTIWHSVIAIFGHYHNDYYYHYCCVSCHGYVKMWDARALAFYSPSPYLFVLLLPTNEPILGLKAFKQIKDICDTMYWEEENGITFAIIDMYITYIYTTQKKQTEGEFFEMASICSDTCIHKGIVCRIEYRFWSFPGRNDCNLHACLLSAQKSYSIRLMHIFLFWGW